MSDNQKTPPQRAMTGGERVARLLEEGVPIKKMTFWAPFFDIPGKDAAGGLDCVLEPKPRSWTAMWIPSIGVIRVLYHSHVANEPAVEALVPVSRCSRFDRFSA